MAFTRDQRSSFQASEPEEQLPSVSSILWNGSLENSLLNSSIGEVGAAGPATQMYPNGSFMPVRFLFDGLEGYEGDASSSIEADSAGFGQSEVLFARPQELSLKPEYRTHSQAPGLTARYDSYVYHDIGVSSQRYALPRSPFSEQSVQSTATGSTTQAEMRSSQSSSSRDFDFSKKWFHEIAIQHSISPNQDESCGQWNASRT